MKKIILQGIKDRERYSRISKQLKRNLLLTTKKEVTVIKKSRVWKKFFDKVLINIVLPVIALIAILAVIFGLSSLLIYFGMEQNTALLLGIAITIGVPSFIGLMRRLYRDALNEVTNENKSLMRDLKGDPR
jgi:hypothetical protein